MSSRLSVVFYIILCLELGAALVVVVVRAGGAVTALIVCLLC